MRKYDIITFDCYGTLIDWETGISDAMMSAARAAGVTLDRRAVLDAHEAVEPAVQAGRFRPYRDVLEVVAQRIAERHGWRLEGAAHETLWRSLPRWRPFPDTNAALEALRAAGYRLGILSNIDDDLLAETRTHFTVPFDLIVTAQQVRSYKPAHPHFVAARKAIGGRPWLHAARSYFHDVEPAVELGIPVVWVNRNQAKPTGAARPTAEVADLAGLVDWLGA